MKDYIIERKTTEFLDEYYAYLEKMHDKLKRREFDEMVNGVPDEREFLREDLDTDEDFTDAEEDYNQAALDNEEQDEEQDEKEDKEEVPELI